MRRIRDPDQNVLKKASSARRNRDRRRNHPTNLSNLTLHISISPTRPGEKQFAIVEAFSTDSKPTPTNGKIPDERRNDMLIGEVKALRERVEILEERNSTPKAKIKSAPNRRSTIPRNVAIKLYRDYRVFFGEKYEEFRKKYGKYKAAKDAASLTIDKIEAETGYKVKLRNLIAAMMERG